MFVISEMITSAELRVLSQKISKHHTCRKHTPSLDSADISSKVIIKTHEIHSITESLFVIEGKTISRLWSTTETMKGF